MVRSKLGGRWWARGASALLAGALVLPLAMSGASAHDGHDGPETLAEPEFSALVFSKTAGFRHSSIPAGIAAIEQLGEEHNFSVDTTEDATDFTVENLAGYDVVVWLSTTGDVLDDEQQAAFEQYIQNGGGYAGIHAASDTEYEWPWYGELVGAYFASHPPGTPNADVAVVDQVHPSTAHLPMRWNRTDEWYNYRENPRGDVHVLATLDETTYAPGNNAMGTDHPIAWCHNYDGGRSWYTGGGHTEASFSEPEFVQHILGGLRTAAGVEGADCTATVESSFEQVTLAKGGGTLGEPIALAVLPNGDVLHTARDGRVFYTTADASTRTAGTIPVYSHDEDGLQGIAIDPNFEENRWVYVYYAPPLDTPDGDAPENGTAEDFAPFEGHNSLSRFKLAEDGTLDLASEQEILRVAADRGICCHAGGEIDFDAEGNLYLSTGDDTNPFASDGYSPIDERDTRNPAFDARRTSGNTNDLRGKLIRIDVKDEIADGAEPGPGSTYDIPSGNLFDGDEYTGDNADLVREEIYAMGFRNPFRFAVDKETGWVHLGDYGPDAGAANPDRGPGGQVEFNLIKEPGNFGWPFCHGANDAYNDYDFATGTSGPKFDCANLVNDSPHNTGLTELPPAVPAWLPYDGGNVPELGSGSESPMGGPTYRYDPDLESPTKWPEYYDGKTFNYEWGRAWIREFVIDDEGTLVDIVPSFDWLDITWVMNAEFGPDGALYILDYGTSWFGGDENSALYRVDYVGQLNPVARIEASATDGPVPLTVEFDAATSTDPDGQELTFEWDFDNDGTVDATGATAEHTYTEPGVHTARLNAVAADGRVGTATVNVTAGNTRPTVELEIPEDGSIFQFGDRVPFKVTVTDPEDGEIDCADVIVEYILGHDSHGHPLSRVNGCEGTIATAADEGHGLDANIFGIINARYADQGGEGGVPSLTGDDEAMLRLRQQQAEFYDDASGVNIFAKDGAAGGQQVGDIHDGDWIAFDPLNLVNIDGVSFRFTSGGAGGTVEMRQGAVDGHLAGTVELASTGGWEVWETSEVVELDALPGTGPVYFVFTGDTEAALFDIDEIRYSGRGAADNVAPTVQAQATPTSGEAPLEVTFTATATDPDGDDVTLTWDFGDGATGEGAEVSHTYTEAGTYTATVTATDSGGATSTATVTVTVGAPPSQCLDVWRDDFDGDSLDERWSVVRQDGNLRVVDGSLVMPTSDTDIYGTNNSATPNLVLQDLPDGPFTATTKLTLEGTGAYQQAGLLLYGDDDNYAKMVFQERSDSRADRVFQFIREENGAPNEVGDSNSPPLGADHPATVWVRLSSDGENLTASYSADGTTFTDMAETKSLAGMDDPRIGLFAVQGAGRPQAPVDASFDDFILTSAAAGAEVGPNDEFDGTALDECRWQVVRPAPEHLRVADGHLELDATPGDIYGGDNQTPANFVLQDLGDGDWTVETVVDTSATTRQYEQGGIMAYVDDDNYVKLDVLTTNSPGAAVSRLVEIRSEVGSVVQNPQPNSPAISATTVHLRLAKEGDTFTGSYSVDGGETWASLPSVTNAPTAAEGRTGLFALGAASTLEPTLRFDYFRVLGDEPPACEPGEVEEGYTALFDGTQASLDEWRMAGPGSFELQEDCTALTVGGMGLLWYPEEFGNYSLKLDWMMAGDDNSGVFVGFPDPGDDPWVAVNQGYEIQIDATDEPDRTTGAIYTFQGADQEARDEALNPPGEWNSYEIVVEGQNIKVYLNDVLINDFDSTHPDRDLTSGFIGLQNHGAGDDVYFRNVRIADLPDEPVEPVLVPVEKVSVQLYSLIPWVSEAGQQSVLARLAEIGLENIEPYGGNFGGFTAEQYRAMVDEIGLRVPSSHYNNAENTFDETLAFVGTLGQEYVGSGGFAAPGIGSYEDTLATAETMNRLGERSVAAGIGKFFGHNHHTEFLTRYDHEGENLSAWEILVRETNPEWVTFQLDVAWATHAGIDVPALLEEYGDRIELLHIKDAVNLGGSGSPSFTNLGEGDVPLQDILRAAEEHAEIAYYVLEYDVAPQGEDFVVTGFEYLTGLEAGEAGSRPVEVTPAEVTFTDEDGTEDDTYTVPWDVGVEYVVDGAVVAPGTYPGSGTVTVTAVPLDGFQPAEGATTEWTHTFSTGGGTPTDPVEAAQALTRSLDRYVASGDVAGPIAGQLARALEQAVRHLEAGRTAQAERSLELFLRHLDNPKRPDTLSAAAQGDLRGQVEVILDLLG